MRKAKYYRALITAILFSSFLKGLCSQEAHVIEVEGKKIPFRFDPKRDVLVVEGEFLKQIPSLNVPQLLSLVANMNFVARGMFQADPEMTGFSQEQIVVMVNGAPLNNAQPGRHHGSGPVRPAKCVRTNYLRHSVSRRRGHGEKILFLNSSIVPI